MSIAEIIFIICKVSFVIGVFSRELYKKITHRPSDECYCCALRSKRILKKIKKSMQKKTK